MIIQDSRERTPFDLSFYGFEITRKSLKTGDYAPFGMEDKFSIDRKASISELVQNLFYGYTRFKKEMIRASLMDNFFLVCEFPVELVYMFPHGSTVPRKKWDGLRATPSLIVHKLNLIYDAYGVKTIFCENRQSAEEMTVKLLNKAINNESFEDIEFFKVNI